MKSNDKYTREFDQKTKKFIYPNFDDEKDGNFAECPNCGARNFDKRVTKVVKCNICQYYAGVAIK